MQACKHCLRTIFEKIVDIFGKQQFSCSFYTSMATSQHYHPQLIHFWTKISDKILKKCNFRQYYILRKYVNLWTFYNCEILLADKNPLFPCLSFYGLKICFDPKLFAEPKFFLGLKLFSVPKFFVKTKKIFTKNLFGLKKKF